MHLPAFAPSWFPWLPPHRRPARVPARACASPAPARPVRTGTQASAADDAATGLRAVLQLLQDQLGLEVVHVAVAVEGGRRFRTVVALRHGPAAAAATGVAGEGALLAIPVRLPDGRVQGQLCCIAPTDAGQRERLARALRHGATLAGRLLEHQRVLQGLERRRAPAAG